MKRPSVSGARPCGARNALVDVPPWWYGPVEDAVMELPTCMKCTEGRMIPLSDYGTDGASVMYKAWVCINPSCGFSIRIDKGQVSYGKKLDPSSH